MSGPILSRICELQGQLLIQSYEKCSLTAYQDEAGIWTIGWGHVASIPDDSVRFGTRAIAEGVTITQEMADAIFVADLFHTEQAVCVLTRDVPTTDNQFAAMVSLTYNIGVNAFKTSRVLAQHRLKQYGQARAAFVLWDKVHYDGALVESLGLHRRRLSEALLYGTAD